MLIRRFQAEDRDAVVALWQRCDLTRPWNDPFRDIERKVASQPALFFVAESEGRVVGSVMAGWDGHRGWANYLAVDPEERGRGLGRALMGAAEDALADLGCPKVNVQIRHGNDAVEFYRRLGFQKDEVVSMGKRLELDEA